MKNLAILGASGHGRVVAEIAELLGWQVCFFDDAYPKLTMNQHWQIRGNTEDLLQQHAQYDACFVAIGNNRIRLEKFLLLQSNSANMISLIHPKAVLSSYVSVEAGSVIMAGAVINAFAKIGRACIINTGAIIEHDCELADGVHVSPNATLAGAVRVGELSWIGMSASIIQCLNVGVNVVVGAGSVIIDNLPDNVLAMGVPAKIREKQ